MTKGSFPGDTQFEGLLGTDPSDVPDPGRPRRWHSVVAAGMKRDAASVIISFIFGMLFEKKGESSRWQNACYIIQRYCVPDPLKTDWEGRILGRYDSVGDGPGQSVGACRLRREVHPAVLSQPGL